MLKLGTKQAIALVSAPWPLFNRPSIQLGSLKAFLQRELPSIPVLTHYLYLHIAESLGYELYRNISEKNWLAESVYGALLFPEQFDSIEKSWWRTSFASSLLPSGRDFQWLCREVEAATRRSLEYPDWSTCSLVGFSICLGQLTSSLYLIRHLKRRAPHIKVVIGGSSCAGKMGASLLKTFPDIDFVVQGEGELPLAHLAASLQQRNSDLNQFSLPGVLARGSSEASPEGQMVQIPFLDNLPMPDYEDYFALLHRFPPEKRFFPKIPMEISRGCWWRKKSPVGKQSGCSFCNLNLQWDGYRSKTRGRIVAEANTLSARHQSLALSFMDNLLPPKGLEELFTEMAVSGKEFQLFAEIRATTPARILAAMAAAGTETVQVGVEALSTSLLGKLNKGTTAMTNLQIMRDCETPGMPNLTGNLILHFPSSDERDVAETLATLAFAFPFRPLKPAAFWLGYESPVYQNPQAYGIRKRGNHSLYKRLFPRPILRNLTFMIQDYSGQKRYQRRIWKKVEEEVRHWQESYDELHGSPGSGPILSYLDGKEFMIIRERRAGRDDMTHRLTGTSRGIYLFCQTHRSIRAILAQFPRLQEDRLLPFLKMMVSKRLMFNEGNRYLSLAVPSRATFSGTHPGSRSMGSNLPAIATPHSGA
ncbi:MAG: RiPP maturation radical SAM C-methyltransferase [Deltaproteobacteria bacterium]|nr:RiPP maturation radical SAM C-methyltransferase [Deltaproteobacteria bacterium]